MGAIKTEIERVSSSLLHVYMYPISVSWVLSFNYNLIKKISIQE